MLGYGQDIVTARKLAFFNLGQFTANATANPEPRFIVPVGGPNVRILGIHFSADAVLADADGTMLIDALVRDASEDADDILVNDFDAETLNTANEAVEATLAADGSEEIRTLEPGDTIRFQLINNSTAIDTNGDVNVCIEYMFVPRDQQDEDEPSYVGYPSQMTDF